MGSQFNFRGFDPSGGGGGGGGRPPPGNFPLARQGSIYSLTFDEFQNTMGSVGKDFGSMNMDELLKNIWSAEEVQSTVLTPGTGNSDVVGGGASILGGGSNGFLQRQGSLTLPRTLSQKTVDEVWKDMSKEFGVNGNGKDGNVIAYSNMPQREPTLGEVTLEEFLVRAGVVREEARMVANANSNPIMSDFSRDQSLGFGFQQPGSNNTGLVNGNQLGMESPSLPVTVNGGRSSSNQTQQVQQQPQPLFPKQPVLPYAAPPVGIPSVAQLSSPRIRGGMVGDMVQNGGLQGMVNGGVTVAATSPAVSSDGLGRSNGDTSSLSPIPYTFSNGLRGRKGGPLEKVVERRQRRMIKNRESAARSRARKQAYTMELEAEVAKLKEENQELLKKQAEIMEMQKNQVMEMMNMQRGGKRQCLRRTQTGPW